MPSLQATLPALAPLFSLGFSPHLLPLPKERQGGNVLPTSITNWHSRDPAIISKYGVHGWDATCSADHCSRHQYRRPLLSASVREAIALGISTGDHCSRHQYRRPLLSASVQEAIALGISTEQYVQVKQRMNLTHLLGDEEHQGTSIKEHNTCVIGTQDFEWIVGFQGSITPVHNNTVCQEKLRTQYYYVRSSIIGRITLGGQVLS